MIEATETEKEILTIIKEAGGRINQQEIIKILKEKKNLAQPDQFVYLYLKSLSQKGLIKKTFHPIKIVSFRENITNEMVEEILKY